MSDYLIHHGIIGQKWGVRRYQNKDGSLTRAGRYHYGYKNQRIVLNDKVKNNDERKDIKVLKRVQKESEFNSEYPFYATHTGHDANFYKAVYGKSLKRRSSDNPQIYSVTLKCKEKLSIPSDETCQKVCGELLKDEAYRNNYIQSIENTKKDLIRPTQHKVLNQALYDVSKDRYDTKDVYHALNMTLVNHSSHSNATADAFYDELKRMGYTALIDTNDKKYSSYHAKEPVIVFDPTIVKLQAVSKLSDDEINKTYPIYNLERIGKEAVNVNTLTGSVANAAFYVNNKINQFTNER